MSQGARSHVSQGSRKSKGSYVDETLFGGNSKSYLKNAGAAIITTDELRTIREQADKGQKADAIVITKNELDRIKSSTVIKTKDEAIQQRKLFEEQKDQQMAQAKARKKKMMELDKERQKKVVPTEYQKDQKFKNETLLTKAMEALDEQEDDVKHMNQMMLYSKVVTIRDKQLDEQKKLEQEWLDEQKRLDLMMEIERLKSLQQQEEREAARKRAQREGSSVIIDQIKEREMDRIKEEEMREREGQMMLKHIEMLKQEEVKMAEQKKIRAGQMMTEVEKANKDAIKIKDGYKRKEIEEDQKIVEYNKSKAQREEEFLAEQRRLHEDKEREVAKLRAMQEKAQDKQSEIDALRAKRAFEESERINRIKEQKELEHKQKVLGELEEARQKQFMDKEMRLAEQAKQNRDEFMRIITTQKQSEEQERRIGNEKKGLLVNHKNEVQLQILQNDERKKQDRLDYLEEGRRVRNKIDEERQKIERIKDKKLTTLKGDAIPEKYTTELAKKKVGF